MSNLDAFLLGLLLAPVLFVVLINFWSDLCTGGDE